MRIGHSLIKPDDHTLMEEMRKTLRLEEQETLLKSSFRTLALFEYFADVRRPLTIGEISGALNMPQSSASALVKSLLDSNYLERYVSGRTYYPTIRLSYLGTRYNRKHEIEAQLGALLYELQRATGETVVLAMRNGIFSQYVLVEYADRQMGEHVHMGSLRPLVCSATGWSLLIDTSDIEIGKLIRRTQVETQNTFWHSTAKNAHEFIGQARELGYAYSQGPSEKGTSGISMNLSFPRANYVLAIGVAGSVKSISDKKKDIVPKLQAFVGQFNLESDALI